MRVLASVVMFSAVLFSASAAAQGTRWEEHNTLIRDKGTIAPLDGAAFGDAISYYSGGLTFTQTDTSIPGNNALPVAVTRTYSVTGHRHPQANLPFGDWDIAVPNIGGIYAVETGWVVEGGGGYTESRCSVPHHVAGSEPSLVGLRPPSAGVSIGDVEAFEPKDYWNGVQVDLGRGAQDILLNTQSPPAEPTGGPWRWVTADRSFIKCLSTIQNGTGEGFLAIDEQGTKYRFDWMAATLETSLRRPSCDPWGACVGAHLNRKRYRLYATLIEDRFGNTVTYTYGNGPNEPVKLTKISSSDGREVTLTYDAHGNVATVLENGRLWTYAYDRTNGVTLISVTRPDSTSWHFDFAELSSLVLQAKPQPPTEPLTCMSVRDVLDADVVVTGTVTHPSGLVGEFKVKPTLFGRTEVPFVCSNYGDPYWEPNQGEPIFPVRWWSPAVISKTTYGPGLPGLGLPTTEQWNYTYDGEWGFNQTIGGTPIQAANGESWVTVTGPNGTWTRYTFGNRYVRDEGLLKKVEVGTGPSNILRTEVNEYIFDEAEAGPFTFYAGLGISPFYGSYSSAAQRPLKSRTISQQGIDFKLETLLFDSWARPVQSIRSSTGAQGSSRTDIVTYNDNHNLWVLGQEESLYNVDTAKMVVARTFSTSNAQILTEHRFGRLHDTLTWNGDGTLQSVTVGSNTTTLSSWKRGIPQTITYADGTSTNAVVNNRGEITSITNELGFMHTYSYDPMGRLARIDYPIGDAIDWAPTIFTLVKSEIEAHNIPAGHWRHQEQTLNRVKTTYLDARWRPLLTHEYDALNPTATQTYVVRAFDHDNRETFVGYPGANPNYAGISHEYDALGRPTKTTQDSEIGVLETTFQYANGFKTIVTNPRGFLTTTKFQVFDAPTADYPVEISGPEGQTTVISRDLFGKPKTITRGGVVRQFEYDLHERLCQRIDPESGATVTEYDASGNVSWTATGVTPIAGACPRASVSEGQKTNFDYDERDRLTMVNRPGNDADTQYGYYLDGALKIIDTGSTAWFYEYNRRRLLTMETLNQDGMFYSFGRVYDRMGNLQVQSYPGDLIVQYAADARGRPTMAGGFAQNAKYHASGALAEFTLGNGIVRTVTENVRRMPSRVSDLYAGVGFHDWAYGYDASGNLLSISDYDSGQSGAQDRQMAYDSLDRLISVSAPNLWGLASYAYDASDNLTAVSVQSGPHARSHAYVYDGNNRLTTINQSGSAVHSFGYDARGNQTVKTTGGAGQSRTFDHANRLTEIPGVARYLYDGHGRRSAVIRLDDTTQENIYTLDGVLRVQRDESQDEFKKYVYLGSTLVGWTKGYALPPTEAPTLTVPSTNQTGSYSISWGEVDRTSRYEWSEDGGAWNSTESFNALIEGKSNGTYQYRVRACNSAGCGPTSPPASVQVMLAPASSPSLNDPPDNYSGSYTFTWGPVLTANRYVLKRYDGVSWSIIHDSSERTKQEVVQSAGTYAYELTACHHDACAPANSIISVTVFQPPIPTLSVPPLNYTGDFDVIWSSSPGATYYVLYRRLGSGSYSNIYQGPATSADSTVSAVGSYGFLVYACNTNLGCGNPSALATTQVALPPVPTLTTPSGTQTSSFTVSWSPSYGATSYTLQRNKNGSSWSTIASSGGNNLGQSGLASGDYGYRVQACGALGCSSYSQPRIVTVVSPPTSAPSLSASPTMVYFPSSFTVSWSSVSGAATYQLQQKKNSGSWSTVQDSSSRSKTIQVNAGQYSYRVRACNAAGCGPYSSTAIVYVESSSNCPPIGPCNDPYSLPTDPPEEW